jgi:putative transposase
MPRPSRLILAGQAHHIIQRGNNRQVIFFEDADRRLFLSMLGDALAAQDCVLHAYVLMTNHFHLLITPGREAAVASLMQSTGRRYVGHVNRTYARTGTLWEGRFKSTIVDTEDYVMACHRYIEANPVRARMVARPEDHIWSSHRRNALGKPDTLIGEHECYRALGDTGEARQAAYRQGFDEGLTEEMIDTLRDATQRGWVPGRDSFRRQIESALGRRVGPPVSGRPRKTREEDAALPLNQADLL